MLVAEAIPVVGAVVEAIPVVAVAATVVAEALEVVVGQPVAGLETVRVGLEAKVVVGQVDDGRGDGFGAQLFFCCWGRDEFGEGNHAVSVGICLSVQFSCLFDGGPRSLGEFLNI